MVLFDFFVCLSGYLPLEGKNVSNFLKFCLIERSYNLIPDSPYSFRTLTESVLGLGTEIPLPRLRYKIVP